jgi:hypothetical protein
LLWADIKLVIYYASMINKHTVRSFDLRLEKNQLLDHMQIYLIKSHPVRNSNPCLMGVILRAFKFPGALEIRFTIFINLRLWVLFYIDLLRNMCRLINCDLKCVHYH